MLSVRDLTTVYGNRIVLHASFDVPSGTVCGLFGPNGSGKTTLFRSCLGLIPSTARRMAARGTDMARLSASERARLLAYVPQDHEPAFPLRVREAVMLGRTPHLGLLGRASDQDRRLVQEALEQLGLAPLADERVDRLSGGQRQLVLIARAVAQDTPVILLDEPASGLDLHNQRLIWLILRRLANAGKAVLCCSHDPNHVSWFCNQAVVLNRGRVVAAGPPSAALAPAILDQLYPGACVVHEDEDHRLVLPRLSSWNTGSASR